MRRLRFLLLFMLFSPLRADGDEYSLGITELYTNNKPDRALPLFQADFRKHPDKWAAVFMIGYVQYAYYHKPDVALPYFQKALALNKENDPQPATLLGDVMRDLSRFDKALAYYNQAGQAFRARNQPVSDNVKYGIAFTYFKMGDAERAYKEAPPGNWLKSYLSPRTIDINWKINVGEGLAKWRLSDEKTIRISLPLDRPFQKLVSFEAKLPEGFTSKRADNKDNRFLEVSRGNQPWPTTLAVSFRVTQNFKKMIPRPAHLQAVDETSPLWGFASENQGGFNSLDNPDFTNLVQRITANGKSTGEKLDLAYRYLRSHFKYEKRIADKNVYEILQSGQGDCGYYSAVAVGLGRALHVPVRFVYGLNSGFDPPLPHAIIEIYDAESRQWFPHDPQSDELYGIIDPTYIPTTAFPANSDSIGRGADGIWQIDIMQFFWAGSGNDTLAVTIKSETPAVASRAADETPHETPKSQGGMLPFFGRK